MMIWISSPPAILLIAVLLDIALGDPKFLPHPVRFCGFLFNLFKKKLLKIDRYERLFGGLFLLTALLITGIVVLLLTHLPGLFGLLLSVYFAYAGLALGCLLREGHRALNLITYGSLDEARQAVSMLVSRDVTKHKKDDLYRTLSETLSENFCDAFIAPLFWLFLGGPVAMWVYKCASTADSMWGYKHYPWTKRGFAAAKLDDALAFFPARISALLLYVAFRGKKNLWPDWRKIRQEALSVESPNAGWSEAVCAYLHQAGMGGPTTYAGEVKNKPWLGPKENEWTHLKLKNLLNHLLLTGILSSIIFFITSVLLSIWF